MSAERPAANIRVTTTKAALDALAAERDRYREALERLQHISTGEEAGEIAKEALS